MLMNDKHSRVVATWEINSGRVVCELFEIRDGDGYSINGDGFGGLDYGTELEVLRRTNQKVLAAYPWARWTR